MTATSAWRGRVNQLLHGADLREDPARIAGRIVDAVVGGTWFDGPAQDWYDAVDAALRSGGPLAPDPDDDAAARHVLAVVRDAMDARRPWPEHPYRQLGEEAWPGLRDAPVVGRLDGSRQDVAVRLHRSFGYVDTAEGARQALVLRLRGGQVVALVGPLHHLERGVDVLSRDEPAGVLAALRELTGLVPSSVPSSGA